MSRVCGLLAALILISALSTHSAAAQESMDVVYLKDGSRYAGVIVELVPEKSVKFRAANGVIYVFDWARVERITKETVDPSGEPAPEGLESWYMLWGLGVAFNTYPTEMQSVLDTYVNEYGASHYPLAIEALGFYWPLGNQRTIVGAIMTGSADRYSFYLPYSGGERAVQVNLYLLSASAMHSFGEVPGDGVLLRADVGLAFSSVGSGDVSQGGGAGMGLLLGAGYGVPVSDETRLLFLAGYSYKSLKEVRIGGVEKPGKSFHTVSLTLEVLL
jgi:hypothetical protein